MAIVGDFAAARHAQSAEPDQIRYCGELFTIASEVGAAPLMDYAEAVQAGVDSESLGGLAAMKGMLRDCLAEDEWPRFWEATRANKVDGETLSLVCAKVYEVISGRPTVSPSDSSDGRSSTSPSSSSWSSRRESLGLVPVDGRVLTG